MAMFSVRVADDLAARFDAAAAVAGGRSARLRQLIQSAAAAGSAGAQRMSQPPRSAARIMVRLDAADAAAVDRAAGEMGMARAGWIAALVRRRLRAVPTFGAPDAMALMAIQVELRRIGVNVNQIARALNTAVLEGRLLELELAALDDLKRETRFQLLAVREAVAGNLAYWDAGP